MSGSAGDKSNRTSDEILAGEYVLGAVSHDARRSLDKRMRADPIFAATVARWRKNLIPIANGVPAGRDDIDEKMCETVRRLPDKGSLLSSRGVSRGQRLWSSLAFWRALTLMLFIYLCFQISRMGGAA